jgi:hypothetical protein
VQDGGLLRGELSPEESLIRFHVLGWRFTEHDGREFHNCPIHDPERSRVRSGSPLEPLKRPGWWSGAGRMASAIMGQARSAAVRVNASGPTPGLVGNSSTNKGAPIP